MDWNKRKKKSIQTALYSKIKESRETGGEWLIKANIQNVPYFSIVATHKKLDCITL